MEDKKVKDRNKKDEKENRKESLFATREEMEEGINRIMGISGK
jgi:hypothetical protein